MACCMITMMGSFSLLANTAAQKLNSSFLLLGFHHFVLRSVLHSLIMAWPRGKKTQQSSEVDSGHDQTNLNPACCCLSCSLRLYEMPHRSNRTHKMVVVSFCLYHLIKLGPTDLYFPYQTNFMDWPHFAWLMIL